MSTDELVALLDEKENLVAEVRRYCSPDGKRTVCHVPLVPDEALNVISLEVDASQYGLAGGRLTSKMRQSFRIARSERALCDEARYRSLMDKKKEVERRRPPA